MREIIIIVIVIVLVSVGSIFTQKYLEKTSDELTAKLEELKNEIKGENFETADSISNEVLAKWQEIKHNWSMVVVHEELDNIELAILGVKGSIEAQNSEDGLVEIEKSMFLVSHIKEKEAFKIKNIF